MSEEYNPDVMIKYEELIKNYESTTYRKFDNLEEKMAGHDIKETMTNFNDLLKTKMNEMKEIKVNIDNFTKFRDGIIEVMKDMQSMEAKYMKLHSMKIHNENGQDIIDTKLEPPSVSGFLSQLSCDLRGDLNSTDIIIPHLIQKQLFTVNILYTDSLCKAYCMIDEKLTEEIAKISKVNEFITVYKDTMRTFDINKELCNKYNCTICYENEVKVCFLPCGHTFCQGCSKRANNKCFICKGVVTDTKTIFLLGGTGDADEVQNSAVAEPIPASVPNQRMQWNVFAR
jgi:hypothetical protein